MKLKDFLHETLIPEILTMPDNIGDWLEPRLEEVFQAERGKYDMDMEDDLLWLAKGVVESLEHTIQVIDQFGDTGDCVSWLLKQIFRESELFPASVEAFRLLREANPELYRPAADELVSHTKAELHAWLMELHFDLKNFEDPHPDIRDFIEALRKGVVALLTQRIREKVDAVYQDGLIAMLEEVLG